MNNDTLIDPVTLGAAVAIAKKKLLPQTTPEDVGEQLVVGSDGKWTKGASITATISVTDTTLTITGGE